MRTDDLYYNKFYHPFHLKEMKNQTQTHFQLKKGDIAQNENADLGIGLDDESKGITLLAS